MASAPVKKVFSATQTKNDQSCTRKQAAGHKEHSRILRTCAGYIQNTLKKASYSQCGNS